MIAETILEVAIAIVLAAVLLALASVVLVPIWMIWWWALS